MSEQETKDLRIACEGSLEECYGTSGSVSDPQPVQDGRNRDHHYSVAVGEQVYGFKSWPEAAKNGEDWRVYAERDLLVSEIALLVEAPNACEVKQTRKLKAKPFDDDDWTVSITKWLQGSVTLDKLSESSLAEIRENGEQFFYEYGQWLAFGVAMKVQDRADRQFVYSPGSGKLSMIDLDYALTGGDIDYSIPLQVLGTIEESRLEKYLACLRKGVVEMNEKLKDKLSEIEARLKNSLYSTNFHSQISDDLPDRAVNGVRERLKKPDGA